MPATFKKDIVSFKGQKATFSRDSGTGSYGKATFSKDIATFKGQKASH